MRQVTRLDHLPPSEVASLETLLTSAKTEATISPMACDGWRNSSSIKSWISLVMWRLPQNVSWAWWQIDCHEHETDTIRLSMFMQTSGHHTCKGTERKNFSEGFLGRGDGNIREDARRATAAVVSSVLVPASTSSATPKNANTGHRVICEVNGTYLMSPVGGAAADGQRRRQCADIRSRESPRHPTLSTAEALGITSM